MDLQAVVEHGRDERPLVRQPSLFLDERGQRNDPVGRQVQSLCGRDKVRRHGLAEAIHHEPDDLFFAHPPREAVRVRK